MSEGVRINGARISKPSAAIRAGDEITFAQGRLIRVVRVEELGARRGPAPEAQALYEDLAPPPPPDRNAAPEAGEPRRAPGAGRPTKRDRRAMDNLRGGDT